MAPNGKHVKTSKPHINVVEYDLKQINTIQLLSVNYIIYIKTYIRSNRSCIYIMMYIFVLVLKWNKCLFPYDYKHFIERQLFLINYYAMS